MLTREEVLQLILYLIVATVLLLASRVRAEEITSSTSERANLTRRSALLRR
jgi:hypothetical protein